MFEIKGKNFYLNGKKFNIYSGTIHYFRVPCEYWEDRLLKLKAAGLNTVETYVAWNMHQPNEDEFCFEGQSDVVHFIETAQKVGLYVIVRPGPYICAEWEFGGFPAWLLKYDDLQVRCYSEPYISLVKQYFDVLLKKLVPLQITHGGPVLMMQLDNEYGSYGRDKKYLAYLRDLMRESGIDVPLFTSDGEGKYHLSGGSLKDEFKVVNFGGYPDECFRNLKEYQPDKPLMCGEMWCGWFDHFREKHHHSANVYSKKTLTKILNQFFENDANFNFYMFHGGTNFGYMAGANYANVYQPTTTSYDYDAPLNEYGDYTFKYNLIRDILCKKQGINPTLPPRPKTQRIGTVELTDTASLAGNIKNIGTHHFDHIPHYMEHYGQNYGMILYHTEIEGNYPDTSVFADGVHDIAYVYVNRKFVGRFDRSVPLTKKQIKYGMAAKESFRFPIPAFNGKIEIDILVEGMGRINFNKQIHDRKGLSCVCIGEQYVYDFDIYTLPIEQLDKLSYDGKNQYPAYFKGKFKAKSKADCFVRFDGFTKGYVFVNGRNLGRYWNVGPQKALYLPGVWLKEDNEIVVLELENCKHKTLTITDSPCFK
ncbi:MAG: beta-galactosidase family protein [Acutalibacteraceae bacterium]